MVSCSLSLSLSDLLYCTYFYMCRSLFLDFLRDQAYCYVDPIIYLPTFRLYSLSLSELSYFHETEKSSFNKTERKNVIFVEETRSATDTFFDILRLIQLCSLFHFELSMFLAAIFLDTEFTSYGQLCNMFLWRWSIFFLRSSSHYVSPDNSYICAKASYKLR